MGQLKENCDVYIKKNYIIFTDIPAAKYSKLFLEGNIIFTISNAKNDEIVTDLLYIKGLVNNFDNDLITDNIKTYNLILNLNDEQIKNPKITVQNTLYTNMISSFSKLENIKSQKIVLTGIDSLQDITIKGKNVILQKDKNNYELNTQHYSKMILYLPYVETSTASFLEKNGNTVNLKVESSDEDPRVMDFNIINDNNDINQNKHALLKIVIDDSIKAAKPKFDGEFGYAFDSGLNEKVIYKEGNDGNEVEQKPDYFPMKKVEMESFPNDETNNDADNTNNDKRGLGLGAKIGIVAGCVSAAAGIGAGIGVPAHKAIKKKKEENEGASIDESFDV